MPLQFVTVPHRDVAKGIDSRSRLNRLADGYSEDLLNVDTNSEGYLAKRKGYQGFGGWIPLRVMQARQTGTTVTLVFDTSLDLTDVDPATNPLIVFGHSSGNSTGAFTETDAYYYLTTWALGVNPYEITFTAATGAMNDNIPSIAVWGIPHTGHYESGHSAPGHVTMLSTYKRAGEERMIAALGGTLYTAESGNAAPFAYYDEQVTITNNPDVDVTLGPRFFPTSYTSTRTNGYVTADNVVGHSVIVSGAQWNSLNTTDYTLYMPNKTVFGTMSSIISTTAGTEDYLTVSGMNYAVLDGRFKIVAVAEPTADTIVVTVENDGIDSSVWDTTSTAGIGTILTDTALMSATSTFAPTDLVYGVDLNPAIDTWFVSQVSGALISFDGITRDRALAAANALTGRHTGAQFVMDSSTSLVLGDMLAHVSGNPALYDSYARQFRVTAINGNLVTLDESVAMSHGDSLHVPTRWIPVEIPTSDQAATLKGRPRLFDTKGYADQSRIRSASVNDSMFFANGDDEIFKYDGTYNYRAGMFPWQAVLGVNNTNVLGPSGSVGQLVSPSLFETLAGVDANNEVLLKTDQATAAFSEGSYVSEAGNYQPIYIITSIPAHADPAGVGETIRIAGPVTTFAAASQVVRLRRFKYYLRINMIDRNQNVVASRMTQSADFDLVAYYQTGGRMMFRLADIPAVDAYDWDRIEVQLYRTATGERGLASAGPYYFAGSYTSQFSTYGNYLFTEDGNPDSVIVNNGNLDTLSAIAGSELGTGWDQPQPARYITSVSNYLVSGYTFGYPTLDVTLKRKPESASFEKFPNFTTLSCPDQPTYTFTYGTANQATYTGLVAYNEWSMLAISTGADTVTLSAHARLYDGDKVQVTSTGTMPGGLLADTDYYIINANRTTSTFQLSATRTGGTPIDITTAGSGTRHLVSMERGVLYNPGGAAIDLTSTDPNKLWPTQTSWFAIDGTVFSTAPNSDTKMGSTLFLTDIIDDATHVTFLANLSFQRLGPSGPVTTDLTLANDHNIPLVIEPRGYTSEFLVSGVQPTTESLWANSLVSAVNEIMGYYAKQGGYRPYLVGYSGVDYGLSRAVFKRVDVGPEPTITFGVGEAPDFDIYVNGVRRPATQYSDVSITAEAGVFPSRVLVSYPNFPEIVDNPDVSDPSTSASVVDVNASDGQEITGLLPFLSQASFGASQVNDIVVVFKTASIYLLKVSTRETTKIDSRGIGCTAPDSIASTQNAIFFANESGMYKLNRDLTVSYVEGKYMEGKWTAVNKDALASCYGYADPQQRRYRMSVPIGDDTTNSEVYNYDYSRESAGTIAEASAAGAWTRYDNHPATYWTTTINGDSYFGTTDGQVFIRRNLGEISDYRDDADAVSEMLIRYKAVDFGEGGARKVVAAVVTDFDFSEEADMSGTVIETAVDLTTNFEEADTVSIQFNPDNLSDRNIKRVQTLRATPPRRRCMQMQVQYRNSVKDSPVIIAGITFVVAGLPARKGITEAGNTAGALA